MVIKKEDTLTPPWCQRMVLQESDFLLGSVSHWVSLAQRAIKMKGRFIVALSGGKTPQKLYQTLSMPEWKQQVNWRHVWLLWSDERAVPPESQSSNYHMAMEAGLGCLEIPKQQILRMEAEKEIVLNAQHYAKQIEQLGKTGKIDLVMLGMGEDGHVASLFPETEALLEEKRLVVANWVPQLNCWRMTMTYPAFECAELTVVYVSGAAKAGTLKAVGEGKKDPLMLPAQRIGTPNAPALWICDGPAASQLSENTGQIGQKGQTEQER